ncbi:TPA: hypothetical protein ACH3X2_007538 [Trebouxia sp. C0005]
MVTSQDKCLYEVLGIEKDASQANIKKAYYKLAMQLHPDKNQGDEEAKAKFQSLQRIYGVLGDPEKRKVYDQTGSLDDSDELAGEQFDSLYKYYRGLYRKVTEEDLDSFQADYRGSEEEAADLLQMYARFKGNMDTVFQWQICSDSKMDSHRFKDCIQNAISSEKVKRYKTFTAWAKDVDARPAPKNPLAKRKKKAGQADSEQALVAAIRGKAPTQMNGLIASLEAKYSKSSARKGKGKREPSVATEEPSEEQFAAARARLENDHAAANGEATTSQPSPKKLKRKR